MINIILDSVVSQKTTIASLYGLPNHFTCPSSQNKYAINIHNITYNDNQKIFF